MKNYRILAIIICLSAYVMLLTSCESPTPNTLTQSDMDHIRELTTNVQNSWNSGDRKPYVSRFSEGAIYMAPNTETVTGKDAIRNLANSFLELKLEFSIIEIFGSAEYANVRGSFVVTSPEGNALDKGKFLSVWRKSPDGQWLLTHDIFNSDLPIPVAKESI